MLLYFKFLFSVQSETCLIKPHKRDLKSTVYLCILQPHWTSSSTDTAWECSECFHATAVPPGWCLTSVLQKWGEKSEIIRNISRPSSKYWFIWNCICLLIPCESLGVDRNFQWIKCDWANHSTRRSFLFLLQLECFLIWVTPLRGLHWSGEYNAASNSRQMFQITARNEPIVWL